MHSIVRATILILACTAIGAAASALLSMWIITAKIGLGGLSGDPVINLLIRPTMTLGGIAGAAAGLLLIIKQRP